MALADCTLTVLAVGQYDKLDQCETVSSYNSPLWYDHRAPTYFDNPKFVMEVGTVVSSTLSWCAVLALYHMIAYDLM